MQIDPLCHPLAISNRHAPLQNTKPPAKHSHPIQRLLEDRAMQQTKEVASVANRTGKKQKINHELGDQRLYKTQAPASAATQSRYKLYAHRGSITTSIMPVTTLMLPPKKKQAISPSKRFQYKGRVIVGICCVTSTARYADSCETQRRAKVAC